MPESISKQSVPEQARPSQWQVYLVYFVGVYVAGIWLIPIMRPGVVELAIGIGWASVCVKPILRAYIAILKKLALLDDDQPSDLTQLPEAPMWLYGAATWGLPRKFRMLYHCTPRLIDFLPALGALLAIVSAQVLWFALSSLTSPWVRYSGMTNDFPVPVQSMVLSATVYVVSFVSFYCIGTIKWYKRLPDA